MDERLCDEISMLILSNLKLRMAVLFKALHHEFPSPKIKEIKFCFIDNFCVSFVEMYSLPCLFKSLRLINYLLRSPIVHRSEVSKDYTIASPKKYKSKEREMRWQIFSFSLWCQDSPWVLWGGDDDGEHGGEVEVEVGRPRGGEQELSAIRQQLVNLGRKNKSLDACPSHIMPCTAQHHLLSTLTSWQIFLASFKLLSFSSSVTLTFDCEVGV